MLTRSQFTIYKNAHGARTAVGYAYLSDDPKACVSCHIMRPQYHGSHKAFAICNDCHLPHTNLPMKSCLKRFTDRLFLSP